MAKRRPLALRMRTLETLLADPWWASLTDQVLAGEAGVERKTVGRARRKMGRMSVLRVCRRGSGLVHTINCSGLVRHASGAGRPPGV